MAILFSQADGSDQHYDTYEEFEQAFILMKRLNGEKVPQDLLDEAKAKYGAKANAEELTYTLNVDTSEILAKIDEFTSGLEDSDVGECSDIKVGDRVRVISAEYDADSNYHHYALGSIGKVTHLYGSGKIEVQVGIGSQTLLSNHYEKLEPLGKDANGEDLYEGDYVMVSENFKYGVTNSNAICEVVSDNDVKLVHTTDFGRKQYEGKSFKHVDLEEFVKLSDNLVEAKEKFDELNGVELEDSPTEFRAGDIVLATEDVVGFGGQYVACNAGELLEVQIGGTGALCLVKDSLKNAYVSENLANIELVCRKEDRKDIGL